MHYLFKTIYGVKYYLNELTAEGIFFSYGKNRILSDVFIKLNTGEVLGLFGRNGSGKTTLLNILFGTLYCPSKILCFNGKNYHNLSDKNIISYLPQKSMLQKRYSVKKCIKYFYGNMKSGHLIRQDKRITKLLNSKITDLSYGELRYLELLLIIYLDTPFVFLDEPFSQIEPKYCVKIKKLIKSFQKQKGFIITDHNYRNIIDVSTKNIVILNGRTIPLKNALTLYDVGYLPKKGLIMNYIKANKAAWEEAFAKHQQGYKLDLGKKLMEKDYYFLAPAALEELKKINLHGKRIVQFCCNNGRELLSIIKLGSLSGTGFDLAENFIKQANRLAIKTGLNAKFIARNIYDIDDSYEKQFDLAFISIGVLCWFQDLDLFFEKIANTMKSGAILLINEQHPFTDMLALQGDKGFEKNNSGKIVFSYFRNDPWVENDGMDYIGGKKYKSKTFYSFSHNFSEIFTAIIKNGITIRELKEYDYDISNSFGHLDKNKYPLSYVLIGKKK